MTIPASLAGLSWQELLALARDVCPDAEIFDIEANGLLDEMDRVHCLHMIRASTEERLRFNEGFFADGTPAPRDGSIVDGLRILMNADDVVGHNIIGYDIPAIQKVYPWFKLKDTCVIWDTMVLARLIWPDIKQIDIAAMKKGKRPEGFGKLAGQHNLKSWGLRLDLLKRDYEGEWHSFTQEMEEYAEFDPVTTLGLWLKCGEKQFCGEAIRLEHDVQVIISMQQRFGFLFNKDAAEALEIVLRGRKAELEDQLRETFRPWVEPERYKGVPVVKEAKRRMQVRRWDENGHEYLVEFAKGETYEKFKLVSFNPGSRQQIANRLITLYGWVPVEFTDAGQPKVDETTLGSLDHIPAAALLIDYLTVDKRLGQLAEGDKAWLKFVEGDGRIRGYVNTLGAITRRMTHSWPNMAQVPSLVNARGKVPYGLECRSLFIVANGNMLVGCDAEGLELRMLAHYMAKFDGGAYADTVVNGKKEDGTDVHTVNQKLIQLNSRNSAKTWIYAYLYGAGLLKLGMVIVEDMTGAQREAFNRKTERQYEALVARKGSQAPKWADFKEAAIARLGRAARTRIEEGLPALGALQAKVKRLAQRDGTLTTVDGGKLKVRHAHASLNTLLQGGGAVVMKKALVILYNLLIDAGFIPNFLTGEMVRGDEVVGFTVNVHDEFQMEGPEHLADWLGELGKDAIRLAGEAYDLRCPLAGSADKGHNWAETH